MIDTEEDSMKKGAFVIPTLVACLVLGTLAPLWGGHRESPIAYPDGYRTWTHIKTMVIQEGHPLYEAFGGVHHIYANQKALKGYREARPFPEGSVIVFDLLDARYLGNAVSEGERKVIAIMVKDSLMYQDTGGWGFEAFRGETRERVVRDPKTECYECHKVRQSIDYVYSAYRK
jgi:hypothetical protein